MTEKNYHFYCEFCGYKRLSNGADIQDMTPVKTTPLQVSLPQLNNEGKLIEAKTREQIKKFKCPGCGKVIVSKKVKNDKSARS